MDWTTFLTPTLGAAGLVVLAVVLIFRGYLIPKTVVDQMRADKDQQINMWKAAFERSQDAITLKDQQIALLLESTKTTTHVVEAMSEAAGFDHGRSHRALAPEE